MRRTSKKILTLALVSSVATLALIPVNADAQRNRTAKLPSVEIHLEVLGSLRQSVANRYMNQPYIAQPVVTPSPGSFAGVVAQQVPPSNRQVIAQPLPRSSSVVASRVASVNTPRGEVIMQPLPGKHKIAKVEPSEEHIIMQEIPIENPEFPNTTEAEIGEIEVAAPLEIPSEPKQEKSIFDKVADFFSGEKAEEPIEHPMLKPSILAATEEVDPFVVPLEAVEPEEVVINTQEAQEAQEAQEVEDESFFSVMQNEIADASAEAEATATAPEVKPEAVAPSEEIIARILSPELMNEVPQERAITEPVEVPQPVIEQRYVDPVVEDEPIMMAAPKEEEVSADPVTQSQPFQSAQLPVPDNFVVADAPPKTLIEPPMLATLPANPLPVEVVTNLPETKESSLVEFEPFEPVESSSSADEKSFPRLSEVETGESINAMVEEIPQNAQEWLNDGASEAVEPAPTIESFAKSEMPDEPARVMESTVVKQKLEMPPSILDEPVKIEPAPAPVVEEPIVSPAPEPTPAVKEVVKKEPVIEPKKPEPKQEKKKNITSPKTEVVKKKLEPIEEPDLDLELTSAEESLLSNAQHPEKTSLSELEDEKPMLEMALDELEPESDSITAAEDMDFALLEEPVEPMAAEIPAPAPTTAKPAAKEEDKGIFPGITKTFKGLLGKEEKAAPIVAAPVAPPSEAPAFDREETAENVLPPELPVSNEFEDIGMPSMELLEDDVEDRFDIESIEEPQIESSEMLDLEPVTVPNEPMSPEPEVAEKELELAALPTEPTVSQPTNSTSVGGVQLSINYGKDDTDIPDEHKTMLTKLAKQAKSEEKRIIISSYASGEADESKAANMISLSRGLSLRAYFIDSGVAMDRIIVQAKGIENTGGAPDRADISIN